MDILKQAKLISDVEGHLLHIEGEILTKFNVQEVANFLIEHGFDEAPSYEVLKSILLDKIFIGMAISLSKRVILEESLIPSGTQVYIEKRHYKVDGEIWVIHKNDADPFPSQPHAHNYEQNMVMHLGNGNLYRKRQYLSTVSKKKFLQFRSKLTDVELPSLEIQS